MTNTTCKSNAQRSSLVPSPGARESVTTAKVCVWLNLWSMAWMVACDITNAEDNNVSDTVAVLCAHTTVSSAFKRWVVHLPDRRHRLYMKKGGSLPRIQQALERYVLTCSVINCSTIIPLLNTYWLHRLMWWFCGFGVWITWYLQPILIHLINYSLYPA